MKFDEESRLEASREYRVLSTPDGGVFNDIALLASRIFSAPIVLVTLIAETTQLFKGRVGRELVEDSREHSFCEFTIRQDAPLIVNDLTLDARFKANPLVLEGLRFYCGVAVRTPDGHPLGTLCLLDRRARTISDDEVRSLQALARRVEGELEMRRRLLLLEETTALQRDEQRGRELLSAMLVHDLRGPLMSLMLSASLVQPADDDSKEDLGRVHESAERMRRMLTDMLDICLYEAGKLKVRKAPIAAAGLVRAVARRLTPTAGEKGQTFQLEFSDEATEVVADPELLERVLSNLVGNAIAHGPWHQPITLALRVAGERTRFEVRDCGKEIALEDRERIFEPLTRGAATSAAGYGLGLAFCRLAVASHGGKLGVEPNAPRGNCFFVELPA